MTDVDVPAYDPAVHTVGEDPLVLLELYCRCGDVRRFVDPVSYCVVQLEDFRARHTGEGHGPVLAEEALAEREARREAGFRAAGRHGEYEAKEYAAPAGPGFDWSAEQEKETA